MERLAGRIKKWLLLEGTEDDLLIASSCHAAGLPVLPVVLKDDPFLDCGAVSIYELLCGRVKSDFPRKESLRYYNEIKVPDGFAISTGIEDPGRNTGKVYFRHQEYARINYRRDFYVESVEWLDKKGVVRSIDHYDRYGEICARTVCRPSGEKISCTWFSDDGAEILVCNYETGDFIYNDGKVRIIRQSVLEIAAFVLECDSVIVSPSEMALSFAESLKPADITVFDETVGYIYPIEHGERDLTEILICTNSDNIEHLEELADTLFEAHFNIAAATTMSEKLKKVGERANVSLYPGCNAKARKKLFEKCGIYLDINHYTELDGAVRKAFMHNELVFAMKETAHNERFSALVYSACDWEKMALKIKRVIAAGASSDLERQHKHAGMADAKAYRKMFG